MRKKVNAVREHLFVYLVVLLSGCASARSVHYARATQYPPTDPAKIEIYRVEPAEPYERLGEIEYNGMAIASWSGAEKMLREKAAAMGADAVLVLQRGTFVSGYSPGVGSYAASSAGGVGTGASSYVGSQPVHRKAMFGVAIKFRQQADTTSK
jgi:hypothetical protein